VLLSHAFQFIYTKTLKTAGTSVEIYFEPACLPRGSATVRQHHTEQTLTPAGIIGYRGGNPSGRTWYNHMPAEEIRSHVGQAIWRAYFKFCVVRNPFDKLVSLWWFNNAKAGRTWDHSDFGTIRNAFCTWCTGHAADAVDRDKYLIGGQIAVDCFIRYENLLEGLEHVCRRIGYPFNPEALGRYKGEFRALKRPFADYYDRPAIAAVEATFAWELDTFGYPTPSAPC
jgi:hypothetical protein